MPAAHYVPDDVFVRIINELADLHMGAAAQANFDPQVWAVNFMGRFVGSGRSLCVSLQRPLRPEV